jgi:plastocyanin
MRRGLAIVGVMALALAAFASSRPTGDARAATTCVKHTKRVVKHVMRHGKRKRVVRIKHYSTCKDVVTPAPAPAPSSPAGVSKDPPSEPIPPGAGSAPLPEPEANAISVTAREGPYSYVPSRPTVHPGRVTVQLNNQGADPHDMAIQRVGGEGEVIELPITPGLWQSTRTVELQAGRYRMWCTLYHHAEDGMETTVTVE